MFRTTLKGLIAHKLRLMMTGLAVVLGVAFMAGTLTFTDTLRNTFNDLFVNVYKNTDAYVRAKAAFKAPPMVGGDQRPRIDAALVNAVKNVDGVVGANADIAGYARLVGKNGKLFGATSGNGPPTVGESWPQVKALNPWRLVAGTAPLRDDDVVLDKRSAEKTGYKVGDLAPIITQGPPTKFRVAGIASFVGASTGGASFTLFTTATAERLIGEPGKVNAIEVAGADNVSQTQLAARIKAVMPAGAEVLTGKEITKETQSLFAQMMGFFSTFLLVFAAIAFVVAFFMILNTFSITVAQRTKENALLRALGASKRQVLGSVIIEAFAVGLIASLIGLGFGFFVAGLLKKLVAAVGMDVPTTGLVFKPTSAIASVVAGVVVTVLAAISPARKAGKVPPVAAMRDLVTGSTGYGSKERIIVGALIVASGIGSLFYGLFGNATSPLAVVGLGALLVFLGVSVLGRTVSLPLSRMISWPLPRIRGAPGLLARENAMRNPKRTAASASALMVGVGLVAFITILAASTKESTNRAVDRAFTGDLVINTGAQMGGGADPGLAAKIAALPEVKTAAGLRMGIALVDGAARMIPAIDPAAGADLFNVKPTNGALADLDKDSIAVWSKVAKDKDLTVGSTLPVTFAQTGEKRMRVALIYAEHQPAGDYFMSTAAYDANYADRYDAVVYVKDAPGVTPATALSAVKHVLTAYPGLTVLDQSGLKREQSKGVNQLLGTVYALLALAVVIALLGIGNTLALSIFERTRELGLLRAVGMTRSQLRSTIRLESVVIALQGTLLGLVIGLFFGWSLVRALKDEGIDTLAIPAPSLIIVVVLAGLAGVAAAILPSRRAAKLDVLRAVVTE